MPNTPQQNSPSGFNPAWNFIAADTPEKQTAAADLYRQQLALQLQQEIAKHAMEQGLASMNPTQSSGRYLIPITGMQSASKLAQAGLSAYLQKGLLDKQADLTAQQGQILAQYLNRGKTTTPQEQSGNGVLSENLPQTALNTGAPQGDMWQTNTNAQRLAQLISSQPKQQTQQQPQQAQSQQSEPFGPADALIYKGIGVPDYYGQGQMPTEQQRNIAAGLRTTLYGTDIGKALEETGTSPGSPEGQVAYKNKLNPLTTTRFGVFERTPTGVKAPEGFVPAVKEETTARTEATEAASNPYKTIMVMENGKLVPKFLPQIAGYPQSQVPQGATPIPRAKPISQTPAQPQANDPFADAPKVQLPSGIGQTEEETAMQKNRADVRTGLFKNFGIAAENANRRVAYNNQALNLVDQADTGIGAARQTLVREAVSKVIPGLSQSDWANTASATQALEAKLTQAAIQKGKQQFGDSFNPAQIGLTGAPGIDQTKPALKFLLQTDNKEAGYDIQRAKDYGTYVQYGHDPMRFNEYYSSKNPLNPALQQVQLGGTRTFATEADAAAAGLTPGTRVKIGNQMGTWH